MSEIAENIVMRMQGVGLIPVFDMSDSVNREPHLAREIIDSELKKMALTEVTAGHIEVKLDFIPVEERLPGDGESAFIIVPYMNFPYMAYRKGGRWMWGYSVNKPVELSVTHWAEIPTLR